MTGLPQGFVLDQPAAGGSGGALPQGFVLDEPQKPTVSAQKKTGPGSEALRQGGRTVRSVVAGVGGGLLDTLNMAAKPVAMGIAYALGDKQGAKLLAAQPSYTDKIRSGFDALTNNYAAPRGGFERKIDNAAEFAASGLGLGGVLGRIAPALAAPKTGQELTSLAAASGAYGASSESDNPYVQAGATLAAGMLPLAPSAGASLLRGAAGISPEKIATIEAAGLAPNMAAAGGNTAKRFANVLGVVPGGSGVMQASNKNTLAAIDSKIKSSIEKVGVPDSIQGAGDALQRGSEKAVQKFKKTYKAMDEDFASVMPQQDKFPVLNTFRQIAKMGENLSPALQKAFENPQLKKVFGALAEDAADGTLSFENMRGLKTKIGDMLDTPSFTTDQPTRELKLLYGALKQDIESAAKNASPEAFQKFQKANTFYAENIKRIERYTERVHAAKKTGEEAYALFAAGAKNGGTRMRNLLHDVPASESGTVRATFLDRLGTNAAGDFDPIRFLGGYQKLAPEAKTVLFRGAESHARDLDKLAKAANLFREVQGFENYSRSGELAVTAGAGTSLLTSLLSGNITAALIGAKAAVGAYIGSQQLAKLMQSPKATRWLAQLPKQATDKALQNHLTKLQVLQREEPEIANDLQGIIDASQQQGGAR